MNRGSDRIATYLTIHSPNIYETKNSGKEVKSWNNYLSPHTHTSGEGGGLIPCTQRQLLMEAKLFSGTTKYQNFLLSP